MKRQSTILFREGEPLISLDLRKNNALSAVISGHITKQIMSGELKPGEKIVEHLYAEEYGTSRAPVREAIYLLTIEGLVERIPRKGAIVKRYTESEVYDLLNIRIMLESLAMKRIQEYGIDADALKEMEMILKDMEDQVNHRNYSELNHSFHMALIKMSQSEVIKNNYLRLGHPLLSIQNLSFSVEGNIEKSIKEHKMLVLLLKKGKLTEADNLLHKHNHDVIVSIQIRLLKGTEE